MAGAPRDDYYVLMWNFLDPMFSSGPERADRAIARFRELACNGATLIASYVDHAHHRETHRRMGLGELNYTLSPRADYRYRENGFPFYVMNLCPALYWDWNKAKPVFQKQYAAFERDGDRSVFVRTPCVNDPAVRAAALERIDRVMEGLSDVRDLSLLYDWRDEPSVTSFVLASDSCFCEHCLAKMRPWLRAKYGDLAALNATWATDFADWDAVTPITTQEALARRAAGVWNFAPWHDHRDFNNRTFADICGALKERIAAHDPAGLSGPTGTQCASVFGGYDMSMLGPVSDWVEAYDFGQSVDCWRSFRPRRDFPIIKTDFSRADPRLLEGMLWGYVFQAGGYSGTIIWESNSMVDVASDDLTPTDRGRGRVEVYAELRSGIPRLLQRTEEVNSPVAVHYSQASVEADFITAVAGRWRSVAAWEPERYPLFDSRAAWWKLLEDRGLRAVFVSSRQIEAGELLARGIKLLVLPRSIAVSDAEAEQMRAFVEAGGVLVGDAAIGRMDENLRERASGALDELFGVRRLGVDGYHHSTQRASLDWEAEPGKRPAWGGGPLRAECTHVEDLLEAADGATVMGCAEYSDAPLGFTRKSGKGRAVLMNAAPTAYLAARRSAGRGAAFQRFFGHVIELAGVQPLAEVLDGDRMPGWRVWRFDHGQAAYFGVAPDLAVTQDVLGGLTGATEGGPREGEARPVTVKLSAAGHVYEARTGRYLGCGDKVSDDLGPTTARLYTVMPYQVEAVELTLADGVAVAAVRADAAPGEHVLRFDVFDADGNRLLDRGANVVAEAGRAEWRPGDLPTGGKITCRDTATGVATEAVIG